MTTPEPNVPVEPSLPEPDELAMELDVPGEAEEMTVQHDPRDGTVDQEEQR
jgi:hypothetical protein